MNKKYILSLDQGTTSSRALIFDIKGEVVGCERKEFSQIFINDGWVEQDPLEILETQLTVCREVIKNTGISADEIAGIGITNQRETTVIWDKNTGKPVYNAIVWQCRRTAQCCEEYKNNGLEKFFQDKTGLLIDPYFSATKIKWILGNVDGAREKAENGEILFGTIDTWLIWNLTGGKVHCTDYSNASRTMLFNIHTLQWDEEILEFMGIPSQILPKVVQSSGFMGMCKKEIFGVEISITGCAGDQQSALFGQCCFSKGDVKNTYGTGGFLLMNTGDEPVTSDNGLLTTIAWGLENKVCYALEGSVFVSGALIKWLRDELELISTASETEQIALSVPDTNGVYIVPAFVGLGAPYWDSSARGTIIGLTRGANKRHIIRASLEAMAYQTLDVLASMEADTGTLNTIRVDGGASQNNFLMQFQADILGRAVVRPYNVESTAMGVAFLAGLGCGLWKSVDEIKSIASNFTEFIPTMDTAERIAHINGWKRAVERSLKWNEA
ncbi:MAG: glycerol kinase GlpK [Ruminococcus sp.]|nr:glycerol kinase GlpK [Ruminococcus sp.]